MATTIQLPPSPGLILLLRLLQTMINHVELNQRTQKNILMLNTLTALSPVTHFPQPSLDLVGYHVGILPGGILGGPTHSRGSVRIVHLRAYVRITQFQDLNTQQMVF